MHCETSQKCGRPITGISIVIPTWKGQALLEKYLPTVVTATRAFEVQCLLPTEIIVTDDCSGDGTAEWIRRSFPAIRYINGEERLGFSGNSNRGILAAKFSHVYLLNNDVAINEETLPPLLHHFQKSSDVFAVASQVYDFDTGLLGGAGQFGGFRRGFLRIHDRYFVSNIEDNTIAEPFLSIFASGGSVLYDREKFLAIGAFDTLFSPYGWEDVEISLRAWRLGYSTHYEPMSPVWHQYSSTIGSVFPRPSVKAIYERNRLMAHWIHLDSPWLLGQHIFFILCKLLRNVLFGQWELADALHQAIRKISEVKRRRNTVATNKKRSLKEILAMILSQAKRPGVRALNQKTAFSRPFVSIETK